MFKLPPAAVFLATLSLIWAEVITHLPTEEKLVAITLDACETKTPAFLDRRITDYLIKRHIPFTLFVSGKFLIRNREEIRKLWETGMVEVENHSYSHYLHMEKLSEGTITREVMRNHELIRELTGRSPVLFRFPGGNYDKTVLEIVESLGYRVVHWSFASGDPDPNIKPRELKEYVLSRTRPGSILIFHVNGRGYSTPKALPQIIEELKRRGYRFILLREFLE